MYKRISAALTISISIILSANGPAIADIQGIFDANSNMAVSSARYHDEARIDTQAAYLWILRNPSTGVILTGFGCCRYSSWDDFYRHNRIPNEGAWWGGAAPQFPPYRAHKVVYDNGRITVYPA